MKNNKTFLTLTCLLLSGAALTGCQTVEGAGQDIENAGESVQQAAE